MGITLIEILKSYIYGFISGILIFVNSILVCLHIDVKDIIAITIAIIISIVIFHVAEVIVKMILKLFKKILT